MTLSKAWTLCSGMVEEREDGTPSLTRREIECLRWLAQGESAKTAAFRLGITKKTVEHYIASAKHKLGAKTSIHAVVLAMKQGIIVIV